MGEPYREVARAPRNGFGTAALLLGIVAILFAVLLGWLLVGVPFAVVFGLLAVMFGFVGRGRAKRGEATNGGVALTGVVLGIFSIVVCIAVGAAWWAFFRSDTGTEYRRCIDAANGDRAAIRQCTDNVKHKVTGVRR